MVATTNTPTTTTTTTTTTTPDPNQIVSIVTPWDRLETSIDALCKEARKAADRIKAFEKRQRQLELEVESLRAMLYGSESATPVDQPLTGWEQP